MPAAHAFSIPVHDLDAAGKVVRFAVPSSWIRGALEGTAVGPGGRDGELNVRISKSGPDVVIHGTLKAEVVVPCARCLEPAPVVVSEPLSVLAVPVASAAPTPGKKDDEEVEIATDDPDFIAYDGETVVLDDLVRDELLLGIPMIPLCSEACPGISPKQLQNATEPPGIDPRLQPLLRLKKSST
ncbi:MAG: YceD family protein [Myxococcota bacterium]|nr:YceD family protein [Myxococcota bacterium]